MYTQDQLDILDANFVETQWQNPRIENGRLIADYYGELLWPIGGGRYHPYNGITTCWIEPSKKLLEKVYDYDFDQHGFVMQQMEFEPLSAPAQRW